MMIFLWALVLTALVLQGVDGTDPAWPTGNGVALLKPKTGCPIGWNNKGFIFQDTVDADPGNNRSEILHIDGNVAFGYVVRYFCVKTSNGGSKWQEGKYCIYGQHKKWMGNALEVGWIEMQDEYYEYRNTDAGRHVSTFAIFSKSKVELNFACKTSGNKKLPISLPISKPFYLLPYGSRECQQVEWMVATSEWIKYHTRDYKDDFQTGGEIPHLTVEEASKGVTMYYCYYQSCNYTLTDMKGVFQSPGFPGKYPDGQLCSWRIVVPDNHTLHVNFTNFSLEKNDNVALFKHYSGSFHLNGTFQGHQERPLTITATSDVLFVFQTNEEGNSTGFRAVYTLSNKFETTPSPPFTTENIGQYTTLNTNTGSLQGTTTPTTENIGRHTTLDTNTGGLHGTIMPTTETGNKTNNTDTFKNSRVSECDGPDTTVLVVVPLICLIVVIAVIIILYRWRAKDTKCEKCASTSRYPKEDAMNPTYDDAGHIQIHQRTSTATMNTTLGTEDNDGQMYQALSGDHDQQPEYEAPDYSKQNDIDDPSNDSGYPEYHELEPMDNNVPDVVYDVLEGPDSDNGPPGDQMYQALDKETTHNPLYQSTHPATMVTKNPMYVDSAA